MDMKVSDVNPSVLVQWMLNDRPSFTRYVGKIRADQIYDITIKEWYNDRDMVFVPMILFNVFAVVYNNLSNHHEFHVSVSDYKDFISNLREEKINSLLYDLD